MQALPIEVGPDGRLRLPSKVAVPANAQLAVLVLEERGDEKVSAAEIGRLAEASGALDFLKEEPDLYTDADIEPGHHNPDFAGDAPGR